VIGIDDFALRKGLVYATIIIEAGDGRRVEVLPGRTGDVTEEWLRRHPEVQVACRDGSGAYGEAISRALPDAVQCGDRWHPRHNLGEAVPKEVADSACWARAPRCRRENAPPPPRSAGTRSATCAPGTSG
jgi:transposase